MVSAMTGMDSGNVKQADDWAVDSNIAVFLALVTTQLSIGSPSKIEDDEKSLSGAIIASAHATLGGYSLCTLSGLTPSDAKFNSCFVGNPYAFMFALANGCDINAEGGATENISLACKLDDNSVFTLICKSLPTIAEAACLARDDGNTDLAKEIDEASTRMFAKVDFETAKRWASIIRKRGSANSANYEKHIATFLAKLFCGVFIYGSQETIKSYDGSGADFFAPISGPIFDFGFEERIKSSQEEEIRGDSWVIAAVGDRAIPGRHVDDFAKSMRASPELTEFLLEVADGKNADQVARAVREVPSQLTGAGARYESFGENSKLLVNLSLTAENAQQVFSTANGTQIGGINYLELTKTVDDGYNAGCQCPFIDTLPARQAIAAAGPAIVAGLETGPEKFTGSLVAMAILRFGGVEAVNALTREQIDGAIEGVTAAENQRRIRLGSQHQEVVSGVTCGVSFANFYGARLQPAAAGPVTAEEEKKLINDTAHAIGSAVCDRGSAASEVHGNGFSNHPREVKFSPNYRRIVQGLSGNSCALAFLAEEAPREVLQFVRLSQATDGCKGEMFKNFAKVIGPDEVRGLFTENEETLDPQLARSDYRPDHAARDLFFGYLLMCGSDSQRRALSERQLVLGLNAIMKYNETSVLPLAGFPTAAVCRELFSRLSDDVLVKLEPQLDAERSQLDQQMRIAIQHHIFFSARGKLSDNLSGEQLFEVMHAIAISGAAAAVRDGSTNLTDTRLDDSGDTFRRDRTIVEFVATLSKAQAKKLVLVINNAAADGNGGREKIKEILFGFADQPANAFCVLAPRQTFPVNIQLLGISRGVPDSISAFPTLAALIEKSGKSMSNDVVELLIANSLPADDISKDLVATAVNIVNHVALLTVFSVEELLPQISDSSKSSFWRITELANDPNRSLIGVRIIVLLQLIFFGFLFQEIRAQFFIAWRVFYASNVVANEILTAVLFATAISSHGFHAVYEKSGIGGAVGKDAFVPIE
ncbi:MAG: hypothetical protein LBB38_02255 [Puniceicoccales bacterium]|nr:hypothetical protein [Puniceicoccales bacterium]